MKEIRLHVFIMLVSTIFVLYIAFLGSCASNLTINSLEKNPLKYSKPLKTIKSIENIYNSTVSIMMFRNNKVKVVAAGVVLRNIKNSSYIVLTAWHVIKNIQELQGKNTLIIVGNKKEAKIKFMTLLGHEKKSDLAILKGIAPEEKSGPSVKIASKEPKIGESVWVIGSPARKEKNVSKGIISNIVVDKNIQYYRTDTDVFFGNSGGGMFNKSGELVGIVHGLTKVGSTFCIVPGSGLIVSLPHIKSFINKLYHRGLL